MAARVHRLSIFRQPLDRAAFVAYFLGAVVPLAALGFVLHTWAPLEQMPERWRDAAIVALVSIGLLSLAAFLMLRRSAQVALGRLDQDNQRLSHLLAASGSLAASSDADELFRVAAEAASQVAAADRGFVISRDPEGSFVPLVSHPAGAIAAEEKGALAGAAEAAAESLRPAVRAAGASGAPGVGLAVPFALGEHQPGALAVWLREAQALDDNTTQAVATLASLARVALGNVELRGAERSFVNQAAQMLVETLSRYLGDRPHHSYNVASLSTMLGRTLDLPESRLERLHFAALLHDLGMLRVAHDKLYDLEEVRRHAVLGDDMLRSIGAWEDLAPFVRHHHEWYDGSGYPDGLAGEAIPIEARIIGVAEAFDAMTAAQSYKRAITIREGLERVRAAAGSQFDPAVVAALTDLYHDGALG